MKICELFAAIILSLVLTSGLLAESLINQLLDESGAVFRSGDEAALFQQWRQKYNIRPEQVRSILNSSRSEHLLSIRFPGNSKEYRLKLFTDDGGRIWRIERDLELTAKTAGAELSQWLNRFVYVIDSGDTSAAYDLVYPASILLEYNGIPDEKRSIRTMRKDFSSTLEIRDLAIEMNSGNYVIHIQAQRLGSILLRVPQRMAPLLNTDHLQKQLLADLRHTWQQIQEGRVTADQRDKGWYYLEQFPHQSSKTLPGESTRLTIELPRKRIPTLATVDFRKSPTVSNGAEAAFSLKIDDSATALMLNDRHPVPIESKGRQVDSQQLLVQLNSILESQFVWWMSGMPNRETRIADDFSGHMVVSGRNDVEFVIRDFESTMGLYHHFMEGNNAYYYPSRVRVNGAEIYIQAVIYLYPERLNYYHFIEVETGYFLRNGAIKAQSVSLNCYAYIREDNVKTIWGRP